MLRVHQKANDSSRLYFEHCRRDILEAIGRAARNVLSVGCGAGATEAQLVRRGVRVVGVELDAEAVQRARERGVIVIRGDASQVDVTPYGPFDCIVYADVLEHLPDPLAVLQRHIHSLTPGGIICVSVPNFRHYSIFWQLFVRGLVEYTDAGILDRTHLRITTRRMVVEWFRQAGLVLAGCRHIIPGRRNRLISGCLLGLGRDFIATQVCLVGRKA
jgi:2-polyprenyl-3-methyl-5-hydroxy-6-metoxy-1,4-benzoquinol methylase